MNPSPPACDDCSHPAEGVQCTPHVFFLTSDLAMRCEKCGRYWVQRGQEIRYWFRIPDEVPPNPFR
jgi:hypothetical protein